MNKENAILCYVDAPWAYFTTQSLENQTGDDWNDSPFEHNADRPYEPCWHNHPDHINQESGRGWKPGTEIPLEPGEMCWCKSCKKDWNEDGTPKWAICRVVYDGPFSTPATSGNGSFSVNQINAGTMAWLFTDSWTKPTVAIPAGTTLRAAGGTVYEEVNE